MNYIPLEKKRKATLECFNSSSTKKRKMKSLSFGGDMRILPRIKSFLDNKKKGSLQFIDEDDLIRELQDTFPEYRRKKRNDLKAAIKRAIELCTAEKGSDCEDDSGSSVIDVEFMPDERYEEVKSAKKSKLKKRKEYFFEEETAATEPECIQNNFNNSSPHFSERHAKDTKDSKFKESQKTPSVIKKIESKGYDLQYPTLTLSDIGGQDTIVEEICDLLVPYRHPQFFSFIDNEKFACSCGVLLHGPPGCGKTRIVHAIAGELKFPLIEVAGTDVISGISGDSEKKIRNLFDYAVSISPCVLHIDGVDVIAGKSGPASKEMGKRVATQLMKSMDSLRTKHANSRVLVIGSTNSADSLDPAVRVDGRFGQEIGIGFPDEAARVSILKVICKDLPLPPEFDFRWLAKSTPGYVGADLAAVVKGAIRKAFKRISQKLCQVLGSDSKMNSKIQHFMEDAGSQMDSIAQASEEFLKRKQRIARTRSVISLSDSEAESFREKLNDEFVINVEDFQVALGAYVPYAKREGFASIPSVTWSDAGALKDVKKQLQRMIVWPVKYKDEYEKFKFSSTSGVLLWGPKGCGKTLLAKAVANESGINFLSVKGPELLNMYVGESERAVRQVFERAKNSSPCVIFFDELDALCASRSNFSGNSAGDRVVNTLLTEMDGIESKKDIFVMGTTNRIEIIDSAILRPGRLDRRIFVGLPSHEGRAEILNALTKNGTQPELADDVNLETIAQDNRCDGFSGADLAFLIKTASEEAFEDYLTNIANGNENTKAVVSLAHFNTVLSKMSPSISEEERRYYENLKFPEEGKKSKA